MLDPCDTIAAIASAPGGAARGIVRVSGPRVRECLEACFVADGAARLADVAGPRAIAGRFVLRDPPAELPCDVYFWPNERSYTRQPTAELHTLGSPPLLEAVLRTLCSAGARPAQPGEFTLRAFLAGRLDLTQAEAVLGVIDATGRGELDAALTQLAGGLSTPLAQLRDRLLDLLARLEAGLDFVDEDIEFIAPDELLAELTGARSLVDELVARVQARGDAAEAVRVALVGRPNTGKSSLFNALAGGAALVSPQAGTTRDYLSARLDLDGLVCELIDTAGLDPAATAGPVIDRAAQDVAAEQQRRAAVELLCLDATRPTDVWENRVLTAGSARPRIVVLTKSDAVTAGSLERRCRDETGALGPKAVATSSATGAGLDVLRARIHAAALAATSTDADVVPATAARCGESLRRAAEMLDRAGELVQSASGDELAAAELRIALDALGEVVGAVYTDDLLDRIFSRFCIGK